LYGVRFLFPYNARMKKRLVLAAALLVSSAALAVKLTPEAAWKADLAETNKHYSVVPHAILKIQDAAYLGEGNMASLVGTKGNPASYKWKNGKVQNAVLVALYAGGKLALTHDGKPIADPLTALPIDKDVDVQAFPTQVQAGVMGVRIFVYNQQNAAAKAFKGVDYFPYDASYIVKASYVADPKLPGRAFRTSRGTDKQFFHAGEATFTLKGKTFKLPFYTDANDPKKVTSLSAFFTDNLTGKVTYGAGRYVDIEGFGKYPPKSLTIDFNYAYNPNCARSAFYTCPLALDNLNLALQAGEKDPHHKN
jgi:uncharacterized protein (DUF1684 family)